MPIFIRCLSTVFLVLLLALPHAIADNTKQASPAFLLANVLGDDVDVTQYLVSEKYDGVRAMWDGQLLRFRSGNVVNAPTWFTAKLPQQKLDGELWLGRERFEELSGVVKKTIPLDEEWRQVNYMVFELPDEPGSFAERYAKMVDLIKKTNWPRLQAVEQFRVADRATLQRKLDTVVKQGGEGLMLHLADAPYITGRSDVLLKLKPTLDTEAKVIGHIAGRGKYKGMMGALEMETPQGKRFRIGSGFSDAVRKTPPPIGTIVTYKYNGLTKKGVPRFASYLRVRQEF
jgi:DNA ligase 1